MSPVPKEKPYLVTMIRVQRLTVQVDAVSTRSAKLAAEMLIADDPHAWQDEKNEELKPEVISIIDLKAELGE